MQLFGLVNTMLGNDRTTAERDLSIARWAAKGWGAQAVRRRREALHCPALPCYLPSIRSTPIHTRPRPSAHSYAVIPLSPNSGLIGWVPNCDTLHALIREYR